ncbi:uncharacterized protein LOC128549929 [Mercenaria mercenaria]|uniref:uncharacterized protein LOC128549929 n=1 Tax=Mercenaria mercenaria TaxID=6596 RepID=UPI00234F7957|nr:uncharacterized protein LOC128549929 [Mercenaria mercenaria]
MNDVDIHFLLDSGSTATLISRETFETCGGEEIYPLHMTDINVNSVDGTNITMHGLIEADIDSGSFKARTTIIVCDISLPGLLGQDFIMKNIVQWNLERMELNTKDGYAIQCQTMESIDRVCRVTVGGEIEIPAKTCMLVPVKIPSSEFLPEVAFVGEMETHQLNDMKVIKGILDPHCNELFIGVINETEDTYTIKEGKEIGRCHPIFEDRFTMDRVNGKSEMCSVVTDNFHGNMKKSAQDSMPEHMKSMFDLGKEHLEDADREKFATLLSNYQDVFAKDSGDLGCTNMVKHKINTRDSYPIRQPARRQPYGKRETEKEEVEKMLEKGVIEPSNSPWSSPVVLVSKKDDSTRFCIDYRKLNEVTVQDAYPIPRVDDCLDALSGSKWFNTMDLCSGFWQIEREEDDKLKTAFSTSGQGLFHFRVMPFGLVNPSTHLSKANGNRSKRDTMGRVFIIYG